MFGYRKEEKRRVNAGSGLSQVRTGVWKPVMFKTKVTHKIFVIFIKYLLDFTINPCFKLFAKLLSTKREKWNPILKYRFKHTPIIEWQHVLGCKEISHCNVMLVLLYHTYKLK
jgi:hypothetical protein